LNRTLLYLGLVLCIVLSYETVHKHFSEKNRIIHTDAEGYYIYLLGTLLYDDFGEIPIHSEGYFTKSSKTSQYYSKYTYGVALMELPSFIVGHTVASILPNVAPNGYSLPYRISILLGALIYVFLALRLLFVLLIAKYSYEISFGVCLCIFFGTNLLHYTIVEPGMSHVYSFFLCSSLYYLFSRNNSIVLIAFCSILLVLIRPTNLFLVLVLLAIFPKTLFDNLRVKPILLVTLLGAVILSIQLYFWYIMTGELVLYSYGNEPKFIHYRSPKMFKVLFDVQNGLFIYSPILIFPFIGLFQSVRAKKSEGWKLLLFFILMTYIFGSWWAWWFGGAFGHRCYVDFYPLLVFPFAYFLHQIKDKRRLNQLVIFALVIFTFYSIRMSVKYSPPWDGATWDWSAWWRVFVRAMLFK